MAIGALVPEPDPELSLFFADHVPLLAPVDHVPLTDELLAKVPLTINVCAPAESDALKASFEMDHEPVSSTIPVEKEPEVAAEYGIWIRVTFPLLTTIMTELFPLAPM